MAHFEVVKDAYLLKAPTMKPDEFPIWSGHIERFGDAMGTQNFAAACQALDDAAIELGFEVAAAPTSQGVGTEAAAPSGKSSVSVGSGVSVGAGVTIGSGDAGTRPEGAPSVRTRARPTRIRIR